MLSLKEGSSLQPMRQGRISTPQLQQTGMRLGRNKGVIGDQAIKKLLEIYEK